MGKLGSIGEPYRFKSLKVYASTEWLYEGKKYRRVFERMETTYLYAELCLYNKLFDEEDWQTTVNLKCFLKTGKNGTKEICSIDEKIDVSKDKNEIFIRQGWGADKAGSFWKAGEYFWEATIGKTMIGSATFYVEEAGLVSGDNNPYFNLQSARTFEGGWEFVDAKDRVYLQSFSKPETRYVWVEINFENKVSNAWQCEIFLNFFDAARQLKGTTAMLNLVDKPSGESLSFASGWGNSNAADTYKQDLYYVEVVFMDTLICTIPLRFGETAEEGEVEVFAPGILNGGTISSTSKPVENVDDVLKELDTLIGLNSIKRQIREHINYIDFVKLRQEKGFQESEKLNLHSIFTGNPGTGKTTVVKMLGRIYKAMGLLSKGHVLEVGRAELVAEFIGQTAPLVKKKINEARGGILFIDEAYALYRKDSEKDFGIEVIEVLIKEMSDGKGDIAIMFAGYPSEMHDFLFSNPGLKSRVNYSFHFDDYLPEELMQIMQYYSGQKKLILSPEAETELSKLIVAEYRQRDKTFGNARMAISLIDEAKMNMARRIMSMPNARELDDEALSTIGLSDVQEIKHSDDKKHFNLSIDEGLLTIALQDLDKLIGLNSIKTDIAELVKLVRYYNDLGKDVTSKFSMHTIFTGNPGTGKTTVARIIGQIYKSLGLLERGNVVEVDRSELVAGYIGQTALKAQEVVNSAMGGVLFIDEAYALTDNSDGKDFGHEAVEVLLKEMEDHRGEFAIIAAGYPVPMEKFLRSNPGLKSRFDRTLNFPDYTDAELLDIAKMMFASESLLMDTDAEAQLLAIIAAMLKSRDEYFGNAREIRKLTVSVIRKQNLRMASMESSQRTPQMIATIIRDDFSDIVIPVATSNPAPLGFRRAGE
ncbi:MAG: AAA family ATPase [Bacteroidetes bacterium HGW-Bacteroidetes-6]|jgi:SpoVK/Ycf46/Vps4 family AAA+-type ATPase|nr:MAG: AAA family ATPase [Bacteroidetes bacterium HGW-Bacteroidetes-6]